jgi:hypothetical protein
MSRRRSKDPTDSIRITIPRSIHDRIKAELGYDASRSAWISKACLMRLQEERPGLDEYSTMRLMSELRYREECNDEMKGIISYWLDQLAIALNPSSKP